MSAHARLKEVAREIRALWDEAEALADQVAAETGILPDVECEVRAAQPEEEHPTGLQPGPWRKDGAESDQREVR